jgi:hypothetical protein
MLQPRVERRECTSEPCPPRHVLTCSDRSASEENVEPHFLQRGLMGSILGSAGSSRYSLCRNNRASRDSDPGFGARLGCSKWRFSFSTCCGSGLFPLMDFFTSITRTVLHRRPRARQQQSRKTLIVRRKRMVFRGLRSGRSLASSRCNRSSSFRGAG